MKDISKRLPAYTGLKEAQKNLEAFYEMMELLSKYPGKSLEFCLHSPRYTRHDDLGY